EATGVRHRGDRGAQPRAPAARPRPAAGLHGPARDVRAAVRLRLRRRDQHAGLRLRGLPAAGDHRAEHRVRRVRHRAGAQRGPQQG
ncbi:MAG: Efflux ABC transporter, permease protein, partial [uncultured Solirubrobacteraceae bacterium]